MSSGIFQFVCNWNERATIAEAETILVLKVTIEELEHLYKESRKIVDRAVFDKRAQKDDQS
jgi:hypothetical protein